MEIPTKNVSQQVKTTPKTLNSPEVPQVFVTVDENNFLEGTKEILKAIRPKWDLNNVEYKLFTDGITNKLVGCFYNDPSQSSPTNGFSHEIIGLSDEIKGSNNHNNDYASKVVLIRIYGNKTDLLIDRNAETRNIKVLHQYGFAPSLYATFSNGLAYEFVPGDTLTPDTVILPEIYTLIAKRMAEMHKVRCETGNISNEVREPMLWKKSHRFLDLVPDKFDNPEIHKRLESFLPVSKLRNEFNDLFKKLESLNSPVVFCHNDLLLGNVIYTKEISRVTFIDYEYADYNFQAFDIGNHFTEFAGINNSVDERYPKKEFQMKWLEVYLKNYLEKNEISQKELEKLYVQVNQFALASHFFWAVWALIQAQHSTIDFDFAKLAIVRYTEYLNKKEEFLSLKYD